MRKHALALPLALSFAVTACTMAPRYQRPDAPIPDTWPSGTAYSASQASERTAADIPWREFIRDQKLRQVIEQALQNNRDLRSTLANIQSARAQYRIQRAVQRLGYAD
jgi:multidrug efflux system outer membrane protein